MSDSLSGMLNGLLQVDPTRREGGSRYIRKHPWFATTDWRATLRKEVAPPVYSDKSEWERYRKEEEMSEETKEETKEETPGAAGDQSGGGSLARNAAHSN
eukprot:CAMPEP_0205914494 /NCGR_PEP_ID=MMETSP1325-20131115/7261_1 /ASSEMBLY_ACC=CAM_ASM_000708 /TAXON_ID=236786 /ORGANISM="Florenciella sp., Strain RCC1007" /LENGTH=99 /DNA_ID=CAMNT_0053281545 /DNA_START=40 /DNA_END=336 /DNA_ORIENTATION=+